MTKHSIALAVIAFALVGCARTSTHRAENLDRGWRFVRRDVDRAGEVKFNDSKWQKVNLPHTWNAKDGSNGGNDYYRGPGWYRRHLKVNKAQLARSLFLRFDGAATVTDVFVNGAAVGQHRGNFGAFCFEVTKLLHEGDNVVAVRVDNSKFDDVPPLSGDFTICGGLYRDVNLLVLDHLSISPMDDASCGVYLTEREVSEREAKVDVLTKLRNAGKTPRNASLIYTISDAQGKAVHRSSQRLRVTPGDVDAPMTLKLDHPHLWNGWRDPYLYHVTIEVTNEQGKVVDRITQPLGLRYYRVDPQEGFFLNGKRYPLHGVNRHQERLGKGWATTPRDVDEDYTFIDEMGANAVRLAHYQHSDYEYGLCDRMGIVVWAELALVNDLRDTPEFAENVKQQLRELIKQNYNHPSILFWSLYNELRLAQKRNLDDYMLVIKLNALAHALDPSRLTTAATLLDVSHPLNWVSDIVAFNKYLGWYAASVDDWPARLDKMRADSPADRAIGFSEYGGGASVKQHEVYPTTRPPTTGPWHPEEKQRSIRLH